MTDNTDQGVGPPPIADRLLGWFDRHGRKDLPWQANPTPYRVWVSEIMLQQTQVSTVIPYFQRFVDRFPDIASLAQAPLDTVLAHWTGLGYYARARNLHRCAQLLWSERDGEFPDSVAELCDLPGIGRSTAGAIVSLALGGRAPILDGNAKRVLARYHAVEGWPGNNAVSRALWALAERETPIERVAGYTQAIMDLGATLCRRSRPECQRCPLRDNCLALLQGEPGRYPGKKPRRAIPVRHTVFVLLVTRDGEVLLERRPPSGVWGGLWSFPETTDATAARALAHEAALRPAAPRALAPFTHVFSHFKLEIAPLRIDCECTGTIVAEPADRRWLPIPEAMALGLPAPVLQLLNALAQDHRNSTGGLP